MWIASASYFNYWILKYHSGHPRLVESMRLKLFFIGSSDLYGYRHTKCSTSVRPCLHCLSPGAFIHANQNALNVQEALTCFAWLGFTHTSTGFERQLEVWENLNTSPPPQAHRSLNCTTYSLISLRIQNQHFSQFDLLLLMHETQFMEQFVSTRRGIL